MQRKRERKEKRNKSNQNPKTQSLKIPDFPISENSNNFTQEIYTYVIDYTESFEKHTHRSSFPFYRHILPH